MKEKFSNIYSDKIKERIVSCSREKDISPVYRLIRHSRSEPICREDFYPRVMEYNDNTMPVYEKQNVKTNILNFAVSLFVSEESLTNYTTLVPSERNTNHFIAKGSISSKFGTATDIDERGHIDHFLFDPLNMNCFELFDEK